MITMNVDALFDLTSWYYSSQLFKSEALIFMKFIVYAHFVLLLRVPSEKSHAIQFTKRTDHSNRPYQEITIVGIKTLL